MPPEDTDRLAREMERVLDDPQLRTGDARGRPHSGQPLQLAGDDRPDRGQLRSRDWTLVATSPQPTPAGAARTRCRRRRTGIRRRARAVAVHPDSVAPPHALERLVLVAARHRRRQPGLLSGLVRALPPGAGARPGPRQLCRARGVSAAADRAGADLRVHPRPARAVSPAPRRQRARRPVDDLHRRGPVGHAAVRRLDVRPLSGRITPDADLRLGADDRAGGVRPRDLPVAAGRAAPARHRRGAHAGRRRQHRRPHDHAGAGRPTASRLRGRRLSVDRRRRPTSAASAAWAPRTSSSASSTRSASPTW